MNSQGRQKLIVNLANIPQKSTGLGSYTKNIFPYLKKLDTTLLSSVTYPEFDCHLIPNNLTSDQGKKGHLNRLLWTQFQLPKIYRSRQSTLLFSPIPEAPLWSQCRSVVTVHDFIPLRFPRRFSPLTPYHLYYVPQVLKQAKHIICNSEATAKDTVALCQIPAHKITPILLAYDAQHFRPITTADSSLNARYFVYIGRHDPHKNVSRLIAAFHELKKSDEYQLWLVGPTDDRHTPLLRQQIQELDLVDRVKFLDYVPYDDLPKIISGAIALVFPSLWEGFGLPVLEAMGCGTSVITSNISSLPEVAGDAAILVDPYNIAELADAMGAIAKDSELRSQLSRLGLARASQFSWEKTGEATAEVLQRFL